MDERHRNLRQALDENRAQSAALTEEEAALHRELAAVHTKLEAARRSKRQLPLANVLLASTMVGDAGRVAVAFKAPVERRHTAGIRMPRRADP